MFTSSRRVDTEFLPFGSEIMPKVAASLKKGNLLTIVPSFELVRSLIFFSLLAGRLCVVTAFDVFWLAAKIKDGTQAGTTHKNRQNRLLAV